MPIKKPAFLLLFFIPLIMVGAAQEDASQDRQVVMQLDEATWVSDIVWKPENSSQVKVTVHSQIPKRISLQEIPDFSGSGGTFQPPDSFTVTPGKNTFYIPVNGRNTLGIAISDRNNGVYQMESQNMNLPEIAGLMVTLFIGVGIALYEGFYFIRTRIKNGLISIRPQRRQ